MEQEMTSMFTPSVHSSADMLNSRCERRKRQRIHRPFPTQLQGEDVRGETFESSTVTENISAGGFYVKLDRQMRSGGRFNASIRFITAANPAGLRVHLSGSVIRTTPLSDGTYGTAARILDYEFE
jgi:hypothetical protein